MRRVLFLLLILLGCEAAPAAPLWTGIVVHHSATAGGDVQSFRRYHVQERGWNDVGYHYVITRDGTIQVGRPLTKTGAHARGRNDTHIGICLVGIDHFTQAQHNALAQLVKDLSAQHPIHTIERHHEECPGHGINDGELYI